jgi:hypothetical protein
MANKPIIIGSQSLILLLKRLVLSVEVLLVDTYSS